jgi:2-polyprenyl-3-methyl-5-hydroxy-6-metoxy-1,4-benzoquinol methylase
MNLHVQKARELFGDKWQQEFDQLMQASDIENPVEAYNRFCRQAARDQARYNATGHWQNVVYATVNQTVYQDADHMKSNYLPGLLLSHWLWPHHDRQMQFFRLSLLSQMIQAQATEFLEVGVGSGAYSWQILQHLPDCQGVAIDISPASLEFAQKLNPTLQTKCVGIEQQPSDSTNWLICVEVLEHLENPKAFLDELYRVLLPTGCAFITAAIDAASYDHIWLYRSAQDVARHIEQAGFYIEQYWTGSAYPPSGQRHVPKVAAFLVKKI